MQNNQSKFVLILREHRNNVKSYLSASITGELHQTLLDSQNQGSYNGLNI
jgi:hypothetical protein